MRLLSFGAGAIGSYIGGSLALQGHELVFIERPEVAEILHRDGLRLRLSDGEHRVEDVCMKTSLEDALSGAPFDGALFALKSFDTTAALEQIKPFAERMPPVICLQNGVENEALIAAALGERRVIAATITSAIGRRGPGDIALERLRGMGLAALQPADNAALVARLAAAFDAAGLHPKIYRRAADMKWSKLLTNLLANATSAILDMTPAGVFADAGLFRLEMEQIREALRVMAEIGARPVDLPGTPVRLLALGAHLPEAVAHPLMRRAVGGGRGAKMPSFHIDLYAGRGQSEVDYLNGAVTRIGERLGIATPVNRLLTDTLTGLTSGEISRDAFAHRPERLLAALGG